ncbi:MAG: tRNA (adenosine(37)-N6)-threonylcarbamoyltransferase complex transferase subunit TsaD [Patescibacteria group bacterium]
MFILGIETSCDETSVAVLKENPPSRPPSPKATEGHSKASEGQETIKVLSNIVSSQIKIHSPFGGVVPSLAAREHEKNLAPVFKKALVKAKTKMADIDLVAVTQGPGLEIALWKGIHFAEDIAKLWNKPFIPVNHLEGHIFSNWLKPVGEFSNSNLQFSKKIFPALNLIVSGGHTQLVLMSNHGKYKLIGETMDDAAGEAFDKVAKMMNLGYPGGPVVSLRAAKIKNQKSKIKIEFPRPMINSGNYNFSFSGLKTSVLYKLREFEEKKIKLDENLINQICREFQQAVIDVLVKKTVSAAKNFKAKSIFLSGGVSANKLLRKTLEKEAKKMGVAYSQPDFQYTGDNAAMIALAGFYKFKNKGAKKLKEIKAEPNLKIKSW